MVKSYLKFEHGKTFGTICSPTSNILWLNERTLKSGGAVVAANEEVLLWDLKKAEILSRWRVDDGYAQVSVISRSATDLDIFAVGYSDGKIRLWDIQTATVIITFNGHKAAVTHLQFDRAGVRLASGSRDTDVIIWDLVGETGLFKLRGHKDQITSLNFLSSDVENPSDDILLTTGKDALIKVWNLNTQHCVETHVTQGNGECWALGLSPDKYGCVTAGNDGELKAWAINYGALKNEGVMLQERGTFYRQGKERIAAVTFHPEADLVAIHGSEKAVELWRIRKEDDIRKALNRKRKRKREKEGDEAEDPAAAMDISTAPIETMIRPYVTLRTGGKVKSMDWASSRPGRSISVLVSLLNNQMETFEVQMSDVDQIPDYNRTSSVDMAGHRTDIRCLAISSDDRMLASASHGSLKIWNARTQSCLRTLDCGYALCATFLPGDKIVAIGTREGNLELFDITSSSLLDTIQAHDKDMWALHVHPDGRSIVTASADKSVKLWNLKVTQEEVLGTDRKVSKLTLVPTKTLKTADDVLSVRFSPDGQLLALSTLDSTVKVFFVDTMKLYLTLYGHKLPVLSMDISYDSKLIVTSSADKTVRVWGLDFGDCHKTFFAHQDGILSVAFIPHNRDGNGHHFFSASKDRLIKYFDGDKFEQIQVLQGHHGEVWAMAISHSGEFVATASHDKSVRTWYQTDEQIFLEEEREKELEELYENTLLTSLDDDVGDEHEVVDASKQTTQTLMAGEKITEALEIGSEDLELMGTYEQAKSLNPKTAYPQRNLIFVAKSNICASQYVLEVFQKIPSASLQDALLVLSYSQLPVLMTFLKVWATEGRNTSLTCRILFFMLKIHQKQIVSSKLLRSSLEDMRDALRLTLEKQRQEIGFNLAGLRITGRQVAEEAEHSSTVEDIYDERRETSRRTRSKRGFVSVA